MLCSRRRVRAKEQGTVAALAQAWSTLFLVEWVSSLPL